MLDDKLIDAAVSLRETRLTERSKFVHGDHWLEGKGWIGEVPVSGFSDYTVAQSGLKKSFAPVDVLSDLKAAHCDAVGGSESPWSTALIRPLKADETPTEAEQALIDEAEALLTDWTTERDMQATVRRALEPLTWANLSESGKPPAAVSPLRLLVSAQGLEPDEDGATRVRASTPVEASRYLYPDAPSPLQAGAVRDTNGLVVGYFYRYARDSQTETEVCGLGKHLYPDDKRFADHCFLEVRRGREVTARIAYDTRGVLLSHELTSSAPFITDSLLSEQKQLNAANTLKVINLKDHGFVQEDILNVNLRGHYTDPSGNVISEREAGNTPGYKFVADPIPKGPNIIRSFSGKVIPGADGKETLATPQVVRHTPSPVTVFEDAMEGSLDKLYLLARQLHRRMSGDAVASGESRITATQDFITSLGPTGAAYQSAVQWLLTAVLRFSAVLSGRPGYFDTLKIICKVRYTAVQPTPDMLRVFSDLRERGQLDLETHLELSNLTSDVDATIARMNAERLVREGVAEKMTLLLTLLDKGVVSVEQLAQEAVKLGLVEGTVTT